MKELLEKIKDNPLRTKEDIQELTKDLLIPIREKLSEEKAGLNVGETSARYSQRIAWLEGFLRPLFGIIPLIKGGGETPIWNEYLEGIKNGTNPTSKEYWGAIKERDQRVVEMTTLGLALAMIPEKIWNPLSIEEKRRLEMWLGQINDCELATNNWLFFPVMVNIGLKKVGAAYSQDVMEAALEKIEESYLSDGWYSDGPTQQRDYYIAFAMHFYGLIYAKLMGEEDAERALKYKERAVIFAKDFIYWFSTDGDALPFGRSLTYRFAMGAFWGALAFADIEVFSWGIMKGIILRHLRWWMKQPIFTSEGILSIGYTYPNLKMAEFYNAPGSPNWAMKTMLPLALPDTHPFWLAEEEELPKLENISAQKHPYMIMMRDEEGKHIQALTGGQYARFEPTHMSAKYEKFAYSNVFGFSVPAGEYGLEQGAYDSMLALCEDDNLYRVRRKCEKVEVRQDMIYTIWKPWKDVEIETWLIPCNPWHIRVHYIKSERELIGAEGGFAINCEWRSQKEEEYTVESKTDRAVAQYPWGVSEIVNLLGNRIGEIVQADPNTNLLYSRTQIPTLKGKIEKGETWLACMVLGKSEIHKKESLSKDIIKITTSDRRMRIKIGDRAYSLIAEDKASNKVEAKFTIKNNMINPAGELTSAELAVFLHRVYNLQ